MRKRRRADRSRSKQVAVATVQTIAAFGSSSTPLCQYLSATSKVSLSTSLYSTSLYLSLPRSTVPLSTSFFLPLSTSLSLFLSLPLFSPFPLLTNLCLHTRVFVHPTGTAKPSPSVCASTSLTSVKEEESRGSLSVALPPDSEELDKDV